nr:MAG TPA: tail tube protein [Caudoviricetes sp.]
MNNMYLTNYNLTLSIGTSYTTDTWTYAELGEGIDNVTEALNEVVQQYQFLADNGFAVNHVTGMAPAWTISGRRILGDTAQDYIAGLKYKLDKDRQSSIKIEYTDASSGTDKKVTITCDCTICNIVDIGGGASTDDSVFSCEIRFDGKPTVTEA